MLETVRRHARAAASPTATLGLLACEYLPPLRPLKVNVEALGPVWLRPGTSDTSVVTEILSGCYDAALNAVNDPALMVDLGAHIGLVSRLFQRRHPDARVVAVEANPANLPVLRRNLPDAQIVAAPIAATHRHVGLTDDRLDGCTIKEDGNLATVTMADIPGTIDLLKVDIEGAEEELFADCDTWIDRVHVIVCECHYPYTAAAMLEQTGGDVVALLKLPKFGYDLVTIRHR